MNDTARFSVARAASAAAVVVAIGRHGMSRSLTPCVFAIPAAITLNTGRRAISSASGMGESTTAIAPLT
jgi:hypothetical protein